VRGTTVPSATVELTLNIPKVVRDVPVKPGDKVKAGDLLLSQEDADEVLRLDILKHEAQTNIPVDAAKAELANKEVEQQRIISMGTAASPSEIDKAKLDVTLGKLQVEKALHEQKRAQLEVTRQEELLKQMKIISPFDAIVQDTPVLKGEVVDPQRPAMVLVKNDPLWVHVHLPSAQSSQLKIGQELGVVYPGERTPTNGKIIYMDPIVDATADRQLVRLELPNADGRAAGLRIHVVLPKELVNPAPAAAAAR
jgi:RND family efflux transporter MFP subunit